MVAQQIQNALDPDQAFSGQAEILVDTSATIEELKAMKEGEYVAFNYRCIKKKTDKAYLFAMQGRNIWLPISGLKLEPGCIVKVKWWIAKRLYNKTESAAI